MYWMQFTLTEIIPDLNRRVKQNWILMYATLTHICRMTICVHVKRGEHFSEKNVLLCGTKLLVSPLASAVAVDKVELKLEEVEYALKERAAAWGGGGGEFSSVVLVIMLLLLFRFSSAWPEVEADTGDGEDEWPLSLAAENIKVHVNQAWKHFFMLKLLLWSSWNTPVEKYKLCFVERRWRGGR